VLGIGADLPETYLRGPGPGCEGGPVSRNSAPRRTGMTSRSTGEMIVFAMVGRALLFRIILSGAGSHK
jgi:hypothetical protein